MLPETQPGTMTNLVLRYAAAETLLTAGKSGKRLSGTLTDMVKHPVEGAHVDVLAVNDQPRPPEHYKLTGMVPAGAAAALFGLRVNTECGCDGPANIEFGAVTYRDKRSGEVQQRRLDPPAKVMRGGRIVVPPGQALMVSTSPFPVTPSDPLYRRCSNGRNLRHSHASGYVTIIFLGHDGKGIGRRNLPFQPVSRMAGTVTTDSRGRFTLLPTPDILSESPGYLIGFDGNGNFRPTTTYIQ